MSRSTITAIKAFFETGDVPTQSHFETLIDTLRGYYYNVKDYGALGDGQYLYNVSMTASSATLTSSGASFVSGDIGKYILVRGAGTSGRDLLTTISAVGSSTSITLGTTAATTVSNQYARYGTDDTTAIQAAITAAHSASGGVVFFPNGSYIIAGALVTSDNLGYNPNAQIYIPSQINTNNGRTHIKIIGETPPNWAALGLGADILRPNGGVWLCSQLAATSGTNPSVIGAANTVVGQNYNYFTIENIGVAVPSNPSGVGVIINGINARNTASLIARHCLVTTESSGYVQVEPQGAYAGILSNKVESETSNLIENCQVWGFRFGYVVTEHVKLIQPAAFCCVVGFCFIRGNSPVSGNIIVNWCKYMLYWPEAATFGETEGTCHVNLSVDTEAYDIDPSRWFATTETILDTNNNGKGVVIYASQLAWTGYSRSTFSKDGGINVLCAPFDTGIYEWTTTGRPTVEGAMGRNTTTNKIEYYNGTTWADLH